VLGRSGGPRTPYLSLPEADDPFGGLETRRNAHNSMKKEPVLLAAFIERHSLILQIGQPVISGSGSRLFFYQGTD
jgi:hypothetical protein